MSDTSTPADRLSFLSLLENGQGDITSATRVANCTMRLRETAAGALNMPDNATFQKAATKIAARVADGRSCRLIG